MEVIIPVEKVRMFIESVVVKAGACEDHAAQLADVLVAADLRGHYSHGLNRLEMYTQDLEAGIAKSGTPVVLSEKLATAWVDGHNLLGPVVGNFCMKIAIKKAKENGIGWVVAKNTNHYGIAAHYGLQAKEQGLIGLSFTNTSPFMAPTRGKTPMIGTNPISCIAPASKGDGFELDMATTTVAVGKVELARRKGESIPKGWCMNSEGHPETNPNNIDSKTGALYPLGGEEETSGYKGYGLGVMVELFCGILAGANFGTNVRWWADIEANKSSKPAPANLGQCFVAIDPSCFAPGFQGRLFEFMDHLRSLDPLDGPEKPVLVPGDKEKENEKQAINQGGISYHQAQIDFYNQFSEKFGVSKLTGKNRDHN